MPITKLKFYSGWKVFAALCWMANPTSADQFGLFSYTDNGTSITITSYSPVAVGSVDIPASIVGKPVTSIRSSAFYYRKGLTSVTIPSSVTSIESSAFHGCSGLTSVTIPSSVTNIENSTFASCSGLTSVTIPSSVISIGSSAFSLCSGLTSVTIPSSVISIGEMAFRSCRGLTSVTIPPSVTSIGSSAFYGCSGLTSVTIPPGVTSIGNSAFYGCSGLTAITVDPSNTAYSSVDGVLFNKSQIFLLQCPGRKTGSYSIPSSVTSIGSSAFFPCIGLTSVTIPSGVTIISEDAFNNCSGLTSVTIPSSVTSIGSYAFYGCSGLTSVTIPSRTTIIGTGVFKSCGSLTAITVDPSNTAYSSADGVLFNKSQTFLLQCPGGKTGSYSVPSSVTMIWDPAFYACKYLTSVTIPSSVTRIDDDVFSSCSIMTAITVDPSNSAYSSADGVLCNKSQTLLIQCPGGKTGTYSIPSSVTNIVSSAFSSCGGLTSVTIPSSVTSIGSFTFSSCSGLTSVTIPSSVTSIDSYAFADCSGLTSVAIPSSVTTIGTGVFRSCASLTAITVDPSNSAYSSADGVLCNKSQTILIQCPGGKTGTYSIPSTVISIESRAFEYCSNLTSVTIPSSVTSIGSYAFYGCSGLGSAVFLGDSPSIRPNNTTGQSFALNAIDFKVYFFEGKSGFTAPTWLGYPSVNMGAPSATAPWLISNGYPHDADLEADPDGDGVSLLIAYSLNLDPKQNLSGAMPQPVFTSNQMSIVFYAGSEGVSYRAESSIDLQSWSAAGVSLSAPNINKFRTATVSSTGPSRFMRIVVDY